MSTPNLRVASLQAHNVLRLSLVEFEWDPKEAVLKIGGKNAAGKSSVLNAVAMALGGAKLCPDEPLKNGEQNGFVEVNLVDLIVRREFSRDTVLLCGPFKDDEPHVHNDKCPKGFGETKSKLILRNPEGIQLGTPQAILDKAIGKLSFDPLQFALLSNEGPEGERRQAEILRRVVSLDTTDLDAKRAAAVQRRAELNRQLTNGEAVLAAMIVHKDAPGEEVPMQSISDEMLKAEGLRRQAEDAERLTAQGDAKLNTIASQRVGLVQRNVDLHKQLEELKRQIENVDSSIAKLDLESEAAAREHDALKITSDAARAVVPDVVELQKKLTEVEATNVKVRANKARQKEYERLQAIEKDAAAADAEVKRLTQEKEDVLKAVKFPIEGLGFGENGVTFNGVPFKQASTAEQIKVSVAVGFALNPDLKLLLVRNGNALDEDSLAVVAAQAEAAGGQILMEFVTKDPSQASVMIEDGHVA